MCILFVVKETRLEIILVIFANEKRGRVLSTYLVYKKFSLAPWKGVVQKNKYYYSMQFVIKWYYQKLLNDTSVKCENRNA